MEGRDYRGPKEADLTTLEDAVRKATGLKFDIVLGMDSPMQRQYYFMIREQVEVPAQIDMAGGQKRFSHLFSKALEHIVDKFRASELWLTREADYKKEVDALVAEIADRDKKIEELLKYKHHYDLEVEKSIKSSQTVYNLCTDGKQKINS